MMRGYFDVWPTAAWAFAFGLAALLFGRALRERCEEKPVPASTLRKIALLMIAVGFMFRLADVWIVGPHGPELIDGFYERAVHLYQGQGFVNWGGGLTALWMPGASYLYLVAFHLFGGPGHAALYATQTLLGFLMIAVAYFFSRLFCDEMTSLLAAALLALFPSQIILGTFGMSDLAFEVSLWGGVTAFAWADRFETSLRKNACLLLSGLFFAFANLTRPYGLPVIALYFAWTLYAQKPRALSRVILVSAMVGIFWSGWIARNYRIFHQFVPFTTTSGINLWVANHPGASGKLEYLSGPHPFLTYLSSPEQELALDRKLKAEATSYIVNHPMIFLKQIPKKWILLLASDTTYLGMVLKNELHLEHRLTKNFLGGLANGYYLALLGIAFWYCATNAKPLFRSPDQGFGILVFASLMILFAVFHVETRFHMPLIPALCVYSALFLRSLLKTSSNSQETSVKPSKLVGRHAL